MAKSVKKKTNRRLKRSVRRTLGALCMITSIIVAAIPFPDAAAEPSSGSEMSYEYDEMIKNGSPVKVDNETSDSDINFINSTVNITNNSDGSHSANPKNGETVYKAYVIPQNSNGTIFLDWQFQFFVPNSKDFAVILNYNKEYDASAVKVSDTVYSDYLQIDETVYNNFLNSDSPSFSETINLDSGTTQILTGAGGQRERKLTFTKNESGSVDISGQDRWFFEKYFSEKLTEIQNGVKNETYTSPYVWTVIPNEAITDSTLKLQYFCDCLFSSDTVNGSDTKTTLVPMQTKAYDTSGNYIGNKYVYIPKSTDGSDNISSSLAYIKDNQGYMCKKQYTVKGIAPYSFEAVNKVKELSFDTNIKYIGDNAFINCTQMLEKVTLAEGTSIGNRSFYNCNKLQEVIFPGGTKTIGAEAFYNCGLVSLTVPSDLMRIGDGAFAECTRLQSIKFDGDKTSNSTIGDYAFYNCIALNTVDFGAAQIEEIGGACFALTKTETGNLTKFVFPKDITEGDKLGYCLLAGRIKLNIVEMPSNLGYQTVTTVPNTVFYKCVNLSCVKFQNNSGLANFDNTIFNTIVNPAFYVEGPKYQIDGTSIAMPRESTHEAKFMNGEKYVPYMYTDENGTFYEISDGKYVMVVDEEGVLVSCDTVGVPSDITLSLSQVGDKPITAFGKDCFSDRIISSLKKLDLSESSVETIDDSVFSNADNLEEVILGNSVTTIGKEAFADCPTLEKVEFGSGITSIGNAAFKNCPDLVEMVFDSPANGPDSFPISNIGSEAFSTGAPKLTVTGDVAEGYAPFAWSMKPDNFVNPATGVRVCYKTHEPSNLTIILDNANNLPTLVDYPQYDDLASEIKTKYESGTAITPAEEALIKATTDIVIPGGVKSIDAKGYFNGDSKSSITPAFSSNQASIDAYFTSGGGALGLDYTKYKEAGLFAADFDEGLPAEEETESKGVDRLKSVTMNSVEYLPDGCFYSCEGLELVDLGTGITDVGSLPFENCTRLASVGCSNSNFACNNGILYENLPDGSKRLAECLAGRGNVVGSSTVSVENDPDLVNVSEIAPAAFRNCKSITGADFTDANNFNEIPDQCFKGSEMLNEVDLPANVRIIGEEAFADTGAYTKVYVRGTEVGLGKNAYDGVRQPYLVSYKDSAVRVAAQKQGVNVDETLDDMHTVKFYMPDGKTLIKTAMVEDGGSAKKEAPDDEEMETFLKEGQKLYGWNGAEDIKAITKDCFFIAKIGLANGIDTDGDGIPDKPADGDNGDNGNNNGNNNSGNNNNGNNNNGNNNTGNNNGNGSASEDNVQKYTLTVVYGDGSGVYASGTKVIISAIEPPAGKEFYKWTTSNTGVTITSATSAATTVKTTNSDATVTATYRDKSTVSGNTVNRKPIGSSTGNSGTSVQITKPGISNTDKAYASVSGSTDNFVVKITESDAAANAVAAALSNEYSDMNPIKYFAMDISLYDKNGNQVTNTNGLSVNITMPIPDALVQYGGNNKVGAVVNGNTLEKLNCKFTTVSGIPCVTFTATHFSPYTIYVDTSNLSVNTLDSTPKTGDGIHPKWFLSLGLLCISILLFMKKDKVTPRKAIVS